MWNNELTPDVGVHVPPDVTLKKALMEYVILIVLMHKMASDVVVDVPSDVPPPPVAHSHHQGHAKVQAGWNVEEVE